MGLSRTGPGRYVGPFAEALATLLLGITLVSVLLALLPDFLNERSFTQRFASYLAAVFTLSFDEVGSAGGGGVILGAALPLSLKLVVGSLCLLVAVALPLGIGRALHPRSRALRATQSLLEGMSSVPLLVWAMAALLLGSQIGHPPVYNVYDDPLRAGAVLVLAIVLLFAGDGLAADVVEEVRVETARVLREPYMTWVRAAGLGFRRHLLKSAAPAFADTLATRTMFLVGATIVLEYIFSIQGLGYHVIHALLAEDKDFGLVLVASLTIMVLGIGVRLALSFVGTAMGAPPRESRSRTGPLVASPSRV